MTIARGTLIRLSRTHKIARQVDETQQIRSFPIWSALALLYPISVMTWVWIGTDSFTLAWNYGLGNLGYLLFAAGIYPGTFKALGLTGRSTVFVVAIFALMTSVLFLAW